MSNNRTIILLRSNKSVAEAAEDVNNNSDEEATKCAICLEDVTNRAQPNACIHNFCYDCIREWSQVKPECPLCKIRFRVIRHNFRSENDYDDFVVPPPPARIPVHYAGILPDHGHDINDDFDEEYLGINVPMVLEAIDGEGRYRFVYPASRAAHRTPRGDWFLNRLLDGTPVTLPPHFPIPRHSHPQVQPVPAQHVPITRIVPTGPVTVRQLDAYAHHHHSPASDAHSSSINRSNIPQHGAEFRRSIYDHNQWVRMRPGNIFPSPEYFRSDPTVIARVTPWLQREVFALLGLSHAESHVSHVSQVLNAILSYVYRVDIRSREFRHAVSNYFGTRTAHFQHEFYNFVLSGMRLDEYDCHATYAVQPPRPASHRHSPPQVNHSAPETVINVSIRTEREVPGHNNAVLQEHDYATPSPNSTSRRAINNDHDYMNTSSRSPAMSASDFLRHGVILPTHVQRLALRNHLMAAGRPAVNDADQGQGVGTSECGRESARPHHHHPVPRPALCHGGSFGLLRPQAHPSAGGIQSEVQRHSCGCTRDFRQPYNPRHHTEPYNGLSSVPLPRNIHSRTGSVSGPQNQEDLYGVMYTPIGLRMVSPQRPSVLLVENENSRNGNQPFPPASHHQHHHHHHHRPVEYPLSHPLVDYPISHPLENYPHSHQIVDYAINHSPTSPHYPIIHHSVEPPFPRPAERPVNPPGAEHPPTSNSNFNQTMERIINDATLNHSAVDRPLNASLGERRGNLTADAINHPEMDRTFNVEFPPSPPAYRVHTERPLTIEDFPILSVRRNASERELESRNANRRPDFQPPQSTSPCRGLLVHDGTSRRWLSSQPLNRGRTEFSQALRDRLVTRMMFQTNERREPSARQQPPGFGVRIEVFPTGTTETTCSPTPSFYAPPTYAGCSAMYSNPGSYPHLRERGSINDTLNTLNAVGRTPSPRGRQSSDDDDCQVVAVQPTPKKPPLDIITLSSDDESLEEIPFARLQDNVDQAVVDSPELQQERTDVPGPSVRNRHRLWKDNSRERENGWIGYSALLAKYQAKKMRLENSPSQAVPCSSSQDSSSSSSKKIDSYLRKDAQIKMLHQLEADTTRLELALGLQNNSNSDNICAVPSGGGDDEGADASSEFSDSDNGSQDGSSSTTAAAAALVGLRYGNPTVSDDNFIKNESIRRSSVIRHTNLAAGSSKAFENSTKPSKQENIEAANPDQISQMKSEMPSTSFIRHSGVVGTPSDDDSSSDIEILYKTEKREPEESLGLSIRPDGQHTTEAKQEKEQCENSEEDSDDDEVTEITRLTESENDDVVEIPFREPVDPNDVYRSMYTAASYENEPAGINYSTADQPGNRREDEYQDYVVVRDSPTPDQDGESCVPLCHVTRDWL